MYRIGAILSAAGLLAGVASWANAQQPVDFAHEILPILQARCAECHSNGTYQGGFSIDDRDAIAESGAVDLDDVSASELLQRVRSGDPDYRMPPEGDRLTGAQIDALERWIKSDLPWEPGFTFLDSDWKSPIGFTAVVVPPGEGNPLDRLMAEYFQRHEIVPEPVVSDAVFMRRAYLDLIGLLPTIEEQDAFLNDSSPGKREALIDQLLARNRDYADHWMTFWNDLLRNDYEGTGYIDGGRTQITRWLHRSLYDNKPYDQFVRELISPADESSSGFIRGIQWRGDVNASQSREVQFSQNVAQVFLGENLKCASCHDSFIDDWKLSDAWGLAAVIAEQPLEMVRCDVPTGQMAEPAFIWPMSRSISTSAPPQQRLEELGGLITGPENGRFARTIANRIWQRMMGRGIIEPVDMMAAEPFAPELVDLLANELRDSNYDLKKLIRLIATSKLYQLPAAAEAEPPSRFVFRGPVQRRLTAEQFLDVTWRLTGTVPEGPNAEIDDYGDGPVLTRASLVVSNLLMRDLGRPNREQVVTTRDDQLSSLQALALSNGLIFHELVRSGASGWLESSISVHEMAINFFRSALCRAPEPSELEVLKELLGPEPTPDSVADMMWAVLLLPEFMHVQ